MSQSSSQVLTNTFHGGNISSTLNRFLKKINKRRDYRFTSTTFFTTVFQLLFFSGISAISFHIRPRVDFQWVEFSTQQS